MGLVLKLLNEWCSINVNAVKVIHLFANLGLALARFAIRLVAQVLLVHSDIRFPIAHRFVLAHPNLVRDLVDETEIVRHEHQPTVVSLDGFCERIDRFQIQVIRRLIEKQQVRTLHANHGKHETGLLTFRQLANFLRLHAPADAVEPRVCTPLFHLTHEFEVIGIFSHEKFQQGHRLVKHID